MTSFNEKYYEEEKNVCWVYEGIVHNASARIVIDAENDDYFVSISQEEPPYGVIDRFDLGDNEGETWVETVEDLKKLFDDIPEDITDFEL